MNIIWNHSVPVSLGRVITSSYKCNVYRCKIGTLQLSDVLISHMFPFTVTSCLKTAVRYGPVTVAVKRTQIFISSKHANLYYGFNESLIWLLKLPGRDLSSFITECVHTVRCMRYFVSYSSVKPLQNKHVPSRLCQNTALGSDARHFPAKDFCLCCSNKCCSSSTGSHKGRHCWSMWRVPSRERWWHQIRAQSTDRTAYLQVIHAWGIMSVVAMHSF